MADPVVNPPQPVLRNATVTAIALVVLTEVAQLTAYEGWWDPPADLLLQLAQLAGLAAGIVIVVQGWFAHDKVMPVEKADALIAKARAEVPASAEYPIKTREDTLAHLAQPMQSFDEMRAQIERDRTERE